MRAEYRKQKTKAKFIEYIRMTWKNKVAAIAMIIAGMLGVIFCENAMALVLFLVIGTPMFFTKKNRFN